MWLPGYHPLLGLASRCVSYSLCFPNASTNIGTFLSDAADVASSPVFDEDPVTGLGSFGDVNDDNNLKNGGFASFRVSYPEPNPLRRQYTLQPYINKPQSPIFPEPARLANSTFTYEKVAEALTCGAGDYSCLQTHVEGMQNMHGGGHSIVGG